MNRNSILSICLLAISFPVLADGPRDNDPNNVRRVPKLGIELSAQQTADLVTALNTLDAAISEVKKKKEQWIQELLPDVLIYSRAVHDAIEYQEFFRPGDVGAALELMREGTDRANQLLDGKAPWMEQRGLVVRGFVSKIDGSVQPYGLVIPESYTHRTAGRYRLDIWFHGRGESSCEVQFLQQRRKNPGVFQPADTIVLHPYGRYSNAFKFAGEVDTLEALESVKNRYRVDEDRISVRGFSMGGAGCWQMAVHYSDRWFASNPGAGFSETPEFLRFFQKETLKPTWWEMKLWHWYDCTDWAANLRQCPTVAYSGENDIQKQAADIMETALEKETIDLVHIIGPKTGHRYHPQARDTVDRRMAQIAKVGLERTPREMTFRTYTLKYNRSSWITIDGLSEHWQPAEVDAKIVDRNTIHLRTSNVTDLTIEFPPATDCLSKTNVEVVLDKGPIKNAKTFQLSVPKSDGSRELRVRKLGALGEWREGPRTTDGLRKVHNLQGPIDDAFMDSFIFVRSTGEAQHQLAGKWSTSELERAIVHWRRHFRGHAGVKNDTAISDEDIAASNLVLWGDPSSNAILKRIADKLPIKWNAKEITVGDRKFSSDNHAVIAIYPNPLNPKKYVVLNSSFTFRDYAYLNNARQVPMLPDWAIVDLRTPPGNVWPGKIVDADFFDEQWQLRPKRSSNAK